MARRHKLVTTAAQKPEPRPQESKTPENVVENTKELSKQHWQLQPLKVKLHKHLQAQGGAVIVTTEMDDQGWFFLVRGVVSPLGSWHGVRVKYVKAVASVGYGG